eukprot:TRINITY_DN3849_c0_g1_i3.p1 TRINITY_DN3849_c0_g1~~TRINITY_DN3849_c0_g1_i3.p1  ORF type:complete len:855 (-),score=108.63 TRINITY_DN3849_c0_g1_i3:453-3017(-)
MSAKGGQHTAATQEQRQLKPIYDAIETRNYKQALKLINSSSSKASDTTLKKALKALCLGHLGENAEAYEFCLDVIRVEPTDEYTMVPVGMTLKRLGKVEDALRMYENAAKKDPKKESHFLGQFATLVRLYDWQKQQMVALKMYKQFGKPEMYWWYITSCYIQGVIKNHLNTIELSHRTIEKLISEGRVLSSEELIFYLQILKRLGRYDIWISLLEGSCAGVLKLPFERLSYLVEAHQSLKHRQPVIDLTRQILLDHDKDSWIHYTSYFDALMQNIDQETFIADVEVAIEMILKLKTETSREKLLKRGPYLAQMELTARLIEARIHRMHPHLVEPMTNLIIDYHTKFGHKRCFLEDVAPYLIFEGTSDNVDSFLLKVKQNSKDIEIINKENQADIIQLQSNYHGLEWRLNKFENISCISDLHSKAAELLELYKKSLQIDAESRVDNRERGSGDDLAMMIGHLHVKAYEISGDKSHILHATAFMESCLQLSPFNYDMKIMLMGFYREFNAFQRIKDLFNSMNISNIQLDSMSFLIQEDALSFGYHAYRADQDKFVVKFHTEYRNDNAEFLMSCFNQGTYAKVEEFMELMDKLRRSTTYFSSLFNLALRFHMRTASAASDYDALLKDAPTQAWEVLDGITSFSTNDDQSVLTPWKLDVLPSSKFSYSKETRLQTVKRLAYSFLLCHGCEHSDLGTLRKLTEERFAELLEYGKVGATNCMESSLRLVVRISAIMPIEADTNQEALRVLFDELYSHVSDASRTYSTKVCPEAIVFLARFVSEFLPCLLSALRFWVKCFPKRKGKKGIDVIEAETRSSLKTLIVNLSTLTTNIIGSITSVVQGRFPIIFSSYYFQTKTRK